MKTAAYVLFVLSALFTIVAISNVFFGNVPNRPTIGSNRFVGYVVGSFLIPLITLILGLVLFNKHKARINKNKSSKSGQL